jgi:hypothetical protein
MTPEKIVLPNGQEINKLPDGSGFFVMDMDDCKPIPKERTINADDAAWLLTLLDLAIPNPKLGEAGDWEGKGREAARKLLTFGTRQ